MHEDLTKRLREGRGSGGDTGCFTGDCAYVGGSGKSPHAQESSQWLPAVLEGGA